jgi:methyl-accepting chemotaxis protein
MSDIATASSEQGAGIEQINQAVLQMDDMTQQNAALVEQTAAASDSLQEQAQTLVAAMSVFVLDEVRQGRSGAPQRMRSVASRNAPQLA